MAAALGIERGVPLPTCRRSTKWAVIANVMEIGDSRLVDGEYKAYNLKTAISRLGRKATVQKDPSGKGWRVWRTG